MALWPQRVSDAQGLDKMTPFDFGQQLLCCSIGLGDDGVTEDEPFTAHN
jgi:hypothetical protein